jgi:DHA3 family tetracycline resistance protein-like MFS transporter
VSERRVLVDRIGILRPLRVRDFRLLWTGMAVSMSGDGVYYVAIAWQVLDLSKSPASLAAVGVAWSLPQVLLTLFSGVLADRFDRRRLMIAGDAIRLLAIGTIGALSIAGALRLSLLLPLVVVYGAGISLFQPSFSAMIPAIVPEDLLVEANSLGQFVRPVAMTVIGPLVAGVVIGTLAVGWAFEVDAATFAFSALMILLLRVRPVRRTEDEPSSVIRDLREGLRYVRIHRWLLISMLAATVSLLFTWGPWETLVPFVVRRDLHGSAGDLGWVFVAGGIGSVLAAATIGQRGALPGKPFLVLYGSWAFGMLMTAGFGLTRSVWQAMAVAFLGEASITVLVIIWFTLVQRLVPSEFLGRVTSLDWVISIGGVPLSFAIVGPVASAIGVDATLILAGLLGGAITIAFLFVPGARDPERDGSLQAPAPQAPPNVTSVD